MPELASEELGCGRPILSPPAVDLQDLRCGAALKKADGLTDDLLLLASPEVPFHVVFATMDALAQDYPHANFGIMR